MITPCRYSLSSIHVPLDPGCEDRVKARVVIVDSSWPGMFPSLMLVTLFVGRSSSNKDNTEESLVIAEPACQRLEIATAPGIYVREVW